jgi:membrane-bound lytic murein transglycosylase B
VQPSRSAFSPARLLAWLAGLVIFGLVGISAVQAAGDPFSPVREHLRKQGVDPKQIQAGFAPGVELRLDTVASVMKIREGELDYGQYLEAWALDKAERFLRRHRELFRRVERELGVDRHTIAAILLVESRFGDYTGVVPTLEILSTLSLMDRPTYRDRVWGRLPPEDRKAMDRSRFDERLKSKARRARKDLRALFVWYGDRPGRIASLKGSIMGAVGWPQFLPDNVLHYGVDADDSGHIDLFAAPDSIFSVATYLRQAGGWRSGDQQAQKQAILRYNHSHPYMETILAVSRRLRQSGD